MTCVSSLGSDKWTSLERKLFNKALATYSKDFIFVQKMVKSKTVAQCVEYYYTWKKIMRLGRKHRTRLAEIIDGCATSEEEEELEEEEEDPDEDRKCAREEESEVSKSPEPPPGPVLAATEGPPLQTLGQPSGSFICEMPNCGAVSVSVTLGHLVRAAGLCLALGNRNGRREKLGRSHKAAASVRDPPAPHAPLTNTHAHTLHPLSSPITKWKGQNGPEL